VLAAHRNQNGRVAFVQDKLLTLAEGETVFLQMPLVEIPITRQGRVGFMVENALAAAAAAWGLGMSAAEIRAGLASFSNEPDMVPGRFNILSVGGATVVLDYGHNVSALQALIDAIASFPHERRTVVYSAAGDRRDSDMIRQGQMLGDHFDRVVLYEDQYTRGRADGEIMSLLRQGLSQAKRAKEIEDHRGGPRSVEAALEALRPGDLLLVQADVIETTIDFVRDYLASHPHLTTPAGETEDETETTRQPAPVMVVERSVERASIYSSVSRRAP
jgi:cyanophycin synthetase